MYKQVFIILLGALLFVVATQSARLPYNNTGGLGHKNQRPPRIHGSVHGDKPIRRRNVTNLDHNLKRTKRDFSDDQLQFQQQMLQAHNQYRSHHCVPPLQLDDGLSASAQNYAQYLVSINTLQHSGTPGVGENLYMFGSSAPIGNINGQQPTDAWYNEISQYNFSEGGFSDATGHFTQVVWKSTQNLGAGVAYSSDNTQVYVVAQYTPPGNYLGQFNDNVLPPTC